MSAVISGEGVALDLEHAGPGSRIVAGLIDLIVQFAALVGFVLIDTAVLGGDDAVAAAVVLTEVVVVLAGYPIVFEWLTRGRTLGKMALGLRVVRDDGGPIGFRQALVRGLAAFLLEKPGLLGIITITIGVVTMTVSRQSKRIGDYMAGTFVVRERVATKSALVAPYFQVPYQLAPWAMALDLSRLDDQLALGLRQFVLRAHQLTPAARDQLGAQFVAQVLAVTSPPPPYGTPIPTILTTVLAERRRRSEQQQLRPY